MARRHNQDYYKVGGSSVEDRDQARMSRAKLAFHASELSKSGAKAPYPLPKGAAARAKKATPKRPAATRAKPAAQANERTAPQAPAVKREKSEAVAEVRAIHVDKPKHGKKRRSAKKRHEVGVLNELRANPDLSPHEAAEALRTSERPIADVIDVRAAAQTRSDAGVPPSALPNAAPREEAGGLFGLARRGFHAGQQAFSFARELVTAPITVAKILRGLREKNAR